jgi:uncharacterized repeat protein (TIGR03847 family)
VPRQVFEYDKPDRFVAGTVGQPGHRTFFLQARSGGRLTSVALEKDQVARLAEGLDALLDEVIRRTGGDPTVPALAPTELDDKAPLDQPIEEEFRVGRMTIAWDASDRCAVIEAFALSAGDAADVGDAAEVGEEDDVATEEATDEGDRSMLIVRLGGAEARAFAKRALAVVAAGRPPCPLCGQPLDPEGHICPRQNGYRR